MEGSGGGVSDKASAISELPALISASQAERNTGANVTKGMRRALELLHQCEPSIQALRPGRVRMTGKQKYIFYTHVDSLLTLEKAADWDLAECRCAHRAESRPS